MRILIIEDDAKTAQAIRRGLHGEGYQTVLASTGDEGLAALAAGGVDLVVLDWMLPGKDGVGVLRVLRGRGSALPVLLLTARDTVEDRVMGLDCGADDYLVKPFAFAELLARLRALARRAGRGEPGLLNMGDLVLDLRGRRVTRGGAEIVLTPREFDLLAYMLHHSGQVVSREMLARDVWRETRRATPLDNVIDVHLGRLRRKIEEGAGARLIHTVRGVGYALREEGEG